MDTTDKELTPYEDIADELLNVSVTPRYNKDQTEIVDYILPTEKTLRQLISQSFGNSTNIGTVQKMARGIQKSIDNPTIPWLKATIERRHSYIFRSGVELNGDRSQLDAFLKIPKNKNFLSIGFFESFNYSQLVEGNIFYLRNTKTNHIFKCPLSQIVDIFVDVDDQSYITHITRRCDIYENGQRKTVEYYIPRYDNIISKTSFVTSTGFKKIDVTDDYVFYDYHTLKPSDEPLAVPLLHMATIYSTAAARLLADDSRYKHAVSLMAIKIMGSTKEARDQAVSVIKSAEGSGGIGAYGDDFTISGFSTAGMNISINGAMEFLSAVAAAVNIPVSILSSNVLGNTGRAALSTLDQPTISYYDTQRSKVIEFFESMINGDSKDGLIIEFPQDSTDSTIKKITGMTTLLDNGLVWQDEARSYGMTQMNIPPLHKDLPDTVEIEKIGKTRSVIKADSSSSGTPHSNIERDNGHDFD